MVTFYNVTNTNYFHIPISSICMQNDSNRFLPLRHIHTKYRFSLPNLITITIIQIIRRHQKEYILYSIYFFINENKIYLFIYTSKITSQNYIHILLKNKQIKQKYFIYTLQIIINLIILCVYFYSHGTHTHTYTIFKIPNFYFNGFQNYICKIYSYFQKQIIFTKKIT